MSPSTPNPIIKKANTIETYLSIAGRSQLDNWWVSKSSTFEAGNYTIKELLDNIKVELLATLPQSSITLNFNS